jgi:putative hydrolase of the HAD superfamily
MEIEAVIFDWGGTLTRWHDIDFHAESLALAHAVVESDREIEVHAEALHRANQAIWGRSRDEQRSASVGDLFTEAGLAHDSELLTHYREFWEPHTQTDPQVAPLWRHLRDSGIRVGVLSNTIWPRDWHEDFFRRDGVLDLIDGDVYTSEIPWTKPSPRAFGADGGGRRLGPGCVRLRGGPAVRRRLGGPQRRSPRDPRPPQHHPSVAGRAHRG